MPLYDGGYQVRQWIHAADIAKAVVDMDDQVRRWIAAGWSGGRKYNLGGTCFYRNIDLVNLIWERCDELGIEVPSQSFVSVEDRPGHDIAYCVDSEKTYATFGWIPQRTIVGSIDGMVEAYKTR